MEKVSEVKRTDFSKYFLYLIDSILAISLYEEKDFVDEVGETNCKDCNASIGQLLTMLINILNH